MSQYSHGLSLSSVCAHLEQNKHLVIPQGKNPTLKGNCWWHRFYCKFCEGKGRFILQTTKQNLKFIIIIFSQTFLQV